ncbi:MAG: periplasmic heavy metal sensor [Cyclobacteriaceae bacterium]|nr:periplasmic heavy metal sensor [Cyclobacteriaceae bacterium]
MNNKPLYIIIAVLIILNVISLGIIWKRPQRPFMRQGPPMNNNIERVFQRHLDLSAAQLSQLEDISGLHRKDIGLLSEELLNKRNEMFKLVNAVSPDTAIIRNLSKEIGILQARLEETNYWYIHQLRSILNTDQQKELDQFLGRMHGNMQRQHRGGRGER